MEESLKLYTEIERVGFGKRLGSSVLDFIISLLPGIILGIYAGAAIAAFLLDFFYDEAQLKTFQAGFSGDIATTIIGFVASLAGIVFTSLFFYILEGFTGQTPGKMILGITVANMNGEKASIDKLLLRALIKITGSFVGIIGFIIFVGCFLVLGEKKQALHDIICKTAIFNKSDIG
ncbi:MAG: hypothetical protein CL841_07005 [Crocinitomicaceae bacterium]|nr:hypothetical protein [Crocinitomicaceae bacterium]|tara:strand:- start:206 stop:733 length:528 start_codon:yes stop_codon:yes gene_type:complete